VANALTAFLVLLGVCFLGATTKVLVEYVRFMRRRQKALLTWPARKPPHYVMMLVIGGALGLLVLFKVLYSHQQAFGETMMFVYYALALPLSWRIHRGFYHDGVWADTAFIPYHEVGGISWREGEHDVALVVISRLRNIARRLTVPGDNYGAARRLLRDKIGEHTIHFTGTGLDLGGHDGRDEV
jgi:hypothetical protein